MFTPTLVNVAVGVHAEQRNILGVGEGGRIVTTTTRDNGYVLTRIADNGCGIPKEIMEQLFELCQSTKPNGSGLGLFAAKHIVEIHKGNLKGESEEGRETSVTIALPVHRPQTEIKPHSPLGGNDTLHHEQ